MCCPSGLRQNNLSSFSNVTVMSFTCWFHMVVGQKLMTSCVTSSKKHEVKKAHLIDLHHRSQKYGCWPQSCELWHLMVNMKRSPDAKFQQQICSILYLSWRATVAEGVSFHSLPHFHLSCIIYSLQAHRLPSVCSSSQMHLDFTTCVQRKHGCLALVFLLKPSWMSRTVERKHLDVFPESLKSCWLKKTFFRRLVKSIRWLKVRPCLLCLVVVGHTETSYRCIGALHAVYSTVMAQLNGDVWVQRDVAWQSPNIDRLLPVEPRNVTKSRLMTYFPPFWIH